MKHIVLFGILSVASLVAGCKRKPLVRDASGKPVFDETKVRHPANTPYFCFSLVDARGDQTSQCEVIKDWCASSIQRSKNEGMTILSGCREVESVSCYVAYSSGGMITAAQSFCWETPKDCEAMSAHSVETQGDANVSTCKVLDSAFQPSR
jgi:hypothetical protein